MAHAIGKDPISMGLLVTHMVRDSAPPLGAEPTRRQRGFSPKVVNWENAEVRHLDSPSPQRILRVVAIQSKAQ